jgi:hypothetical protein
MPLPARAHVLRSNGASPRAPGCYLESTPQCPDDKPNEDTEEDDCDGDLAPKAEVSDRGLDPITPGVGQSIAYSLD